MEHRVRFIKDDLEFLSVPVDDEIDNISDYISEAIINGHVFDMEISDGDRVVLTPEMIAGGCFVIEKVEE